jgi:hypothetical protein
LNVDERRRPREDIKVLFLQSSFFNPNNQGRKTKFAFPLYTVGTKKKISFRSHCIQGKRKICFSSLQTMHMEIEENLLILT